MSILCCPRQSESNNTATQSQISQGARSTKVTTLTPCILNSRLAYPSNRLACPVPLVNKNLSIYLRGSNLMRAQDRTWWRQLNTKVMPITTSNSVQCSQECFWMKPQLYTVVNPRHTDPANQVMKNNFKLKTDSLQNILLNIIFV